MPFIDYQAPAKTCRSREHNPPSMIVLKPGRHTYQCPDCREQTTVYVPEVVVTLVRGTLLSTGSA